MDQEAGTTVDPEQNLNLPPTGQGVKLFSFFLCVLYLFKNMLEHQISICTEPSLFVYLGTRRIRKKKGEFKCDKANILPSFTLSTQSMN